MMWPKEMFEWKKKPLKIREDELKQLIAEKSSAYVKDFVCERELLVDESFDSIYWNYNTERT